MIRIRPATAQDEKRIAEIILASMQASYARFLPAHLFQRILDLDRPGQVARDDAPRFSVAEIDSVPAGVMLLKDDYVDHLWVRPKFMGKGVGGALLRHAEERAARAGFDRLTLDCFEKNSDALAFYRAKGFCAEKTYTATNYLAGEPVCLMVKSLTTR